MSTILLCEALLLFFIPSIIALLCCKKVTKKDIKYYLGLDYTINEQHVKILELYKEFLILNCGFVNTKSSNDLSTSSWIVWV